MEFLKINKFAGLLAIVCSFLIPNMAEAEQVYYINMSSLIYEKSTNDTDPGTNVFTDLNTNVENIQFEDGGNAFFYARFESGTYRIYKKNVEDSGIGTPLTTTAVYARFFAYRGTSIVYCYNDRMYMRDNSDVLYDGYDIGPCSAGVPIAMSPNGVKILHEMPDGLYLKDISDSGTGTFLFTTTGTTFSIFSGQTTNSEGKFCYSDGNIKCTENFWNDPVPGIDLGFSGDYYFFFLKDNPDGFIYRNASDSYRPYLYNGSTSSLLVDAPYFQGGNSEYIPSPPTPPTVVSQINGLNCETFQYPDLNTVSWNNDFMNQGNFYDFDNGSGSRTFYSWSGANITDGPFNAVYFAPCAGTGCTFNSGSLNYPGTGITRFSLGENSMQISFRDSAINPNVIQFSGTSNVSGGYSGLADVLTTRRDFFENIQLSSSGGISTLGIVRNLYFDSINFSFIRQFNGFRYGVAPLANKTQCSLKYNICEWSYEGDNLACIPGNLVGGIQAGSCTVAGTGSIYGSGSCIPTTNENGEIIPPSYIPGISIVDSEGNVIGTINKTENNLSFSCGFTDDDGWTDTIGKGIRCFFNLIQTSVSSTKDGIDIIQGTSQTLGQSVDINPTTSTGSATGALSNPLLAQLKGVEEEASETKYLKMTFGFFVFFFTILIVAVLATVLKGGIKNYFNQ